MNESARRLLWVATPTLLIGVIASLVLASVAPYEAGAGSDSPELTPEEAAAYKRYVTEEVIPNADDPNRMRETE